MNSNEFYVQALDLKSDPIKGGYKSFWRDVTIGMTKRQAKRYFIENRSSYGKLRIVMRLK